MRYASPYDVLERFLLEPKARILGHIGFSYKHILTESSDVPTACVTYSKRTIEYNTGFWLSLTDGERAFIVGHEIGHALLLHMFRRDGFPNDVWAIGSDVAINEMLKVDCKGFMDIPKDAYTAQTIKCGQRCMDAEYYCKFLMQNGNNADQQTKESEFNKPDFGDEDKDDPEGIEYVDAVADVEKAAELANEQGGSSLVGAVTGTIEKVKAERSVVDWKRELERWAKKTKRSGLSWMTPRKQRMHLGYFPGPKRRKVDPVVVVAVDTSASIQEWMFRQVAGECAGIGSILKLPFRFIQWGSSIVYDKVVPPKEMSKIKFVKGGGTNIKPVLDAFLKEDRDAKLIVFTDGYFGLPNDYARKGDVAWFVTTTVTLGWGTTKHIKFKE